MRKLLPFLQSFLGIFTLLLFFTLKTYAAGELKINLTTTNKQQISGSTLTGQLFTISIDPNTNNGCKDAFIVTFTIIQRKDGTVTSTNTYTKQIDGNNNNAKFGPIAYDSPRQLEISAVCNANKQQKTGSTTIEITQDPATAPVEKPELLVSPTAARYGEDVTMRVTKCPANSTVEYFWTNRDGSQQKSSGPKSPAETFTLQFQAPNNSTQDQNSKIVYARCGGKQSDAISMTFQHPSLSTPTPKTDAPGTSSSNNGSTINDGKVDMFEFKSPSYLPQYTNRYKILNNILSLVLSIISVISTGFLIWGGIQFITSEGDKQKVQAARGRITYAILGLIIAFLSFLIVQLIGYVFDLQSTGRTILDVTL